MSDLDEPIFDTVKRDLKSFFVKGRYVLFPFSSDTKVKELRDWDLFGPLIISIALTSLMILKGSISDADKIVAANFLILILGSIIVTVNAKLIGVKFSVFFYVCVLGYSLFPFVLAAAANLFIGFIVTRLGIFIITFFCYLWAVKSVSVIFKLTIKK